VSFEGLSRESIDRIVKEVFTVLRARMRRARLGD
jgi:hypothetical protein